MSGNPHWFSRVAEHLEVNEDNFVDADGDGNDDDKRKAICVKLATPTGSPGLTDDDDKVVDADKDGHC